MPMNPTSVNVDRVSNDCSRKRKLREALKSAHVKSDLVFGNTRELAAFRELSRAMGVPFFSARGQLERATKGIDSAPAIRRVIEFVNRRAKSGTPVPDCRSTAGAAQETLQF